MGNPPQPKVRLRHLDKPTHCMDCGTELYISPHITTFRCLSCANKHRWTIIKLERDEAIELCPHNVRSILERADKRWMNLD